MNRLLFHLELFVFCVRVCGWVYGVSLVMTEYGLQHWLTHKSFCSEIIIGRINMRHFLLNFLLHFIFSKIYKYCISIGDVVCWAYSYVRKSQAFVQLLNFISIEN